MTLAHGKPTRMVGTVGICDRSRGDSVNAGLPAGEQGSVELRGSLADVLSAAWEAHRGLISCHAIIIQASGPELLSAVTVKICSLPAETPRARHWRTQKIRPKLETSRSPQILPSSPWSSL